MIKPPISSEHLTDDEKTVYAVIERSGSFDRAFYLNKYPDVAAFNHDPIAHYITIGASEGRNPNPYFQTIYYCHANQDVETAGLNPLYHYILHGLAEGRPASSGPERNRLNMPLRTIYELIDESGMFDRDFYCATYEDIGRAGTDPLSHYIIYGYQEGRNPSAAFDTNFYLDTNTDVAGSGINPLLHYALYGAAEGRLTLPLDAELYGLHGHDAKARSQAEEEIADIQASGLFDAVWYRSSYPEIGTADPIRHFYETGGRDGFDPSPFFDSAAYLAGNKDVAFAGINPLLHWLRHGRLEGRKVPVKQSRKSRQMLTLAELCDPLHEEAWRSDPIDILFSILTPTYNTDPAWLRELYQTLRNQTYAGWEWVVCDDCSTRAETINTLRQIAANDPRVVLTPLLTKDGGISAATNAALAVAKGTYAALVDHDDLLARNVLASVRSAILANGGNVDIVYTDECKLSLDNEIYDIFLKPAWSPVLLENTMYVGHLTLYRTQFMRGLKGLRSEFDGTQDYDLALRASDQTSRVVHIPVIGYLWRAVPGSTASSLHEKSYTLARQEKALNAFAHDRDATAKVGIGFSLGYWRLDFPLPVARPKLSYVIPTAAGKRIVRGMTVDLLSHCIERLEATAFYPDPEFIVVHNGNLSSEQSAFLSRRASVKLVEYRSKAFNLAEKINQGVRAASGDYVCLLNDDVEAITPKGGESLIAYLEVRPSVGAISPMCLFEDGMTQHNGVLLLAQGPSHAGIFQRPEFGGHAGFLRCRREVFAVSGAMLFCRRTLYLELGGFDEDFPLNYNDIDFCLRLRRAGYSCVVDPAIQVYHFESASKTGTFRCEKERLFAKWRDLADPYFNPGFDQRDPSFTVQLPRQEASIKDPIAFERWLDERIASRSSNHDGTEGATFTVGVSVFNQSAQLLDEMLASFMMQTYSARELIILDNGSSSPDTLDWLKRVNTSGNLRVLRAKDNQGIAGGQRLLLEHAMAEWFVPIDADDFITVDALAVFAKAIHTSPEAEIFYSDEFKSDINSNKFAPFFKTEFDPIWITNCCYTGHLMAMKVDRLRAMHAYSDDRAAWCHDWDTTFRAVACGLVPVHVPEQLYGWRINPGSTASAETGAKPEAAASQRFVLERAIAARGLTGLLSVSPNPIWPHSGMWSLETAKPVPNVAILSEAIWRDSDPGTPLMDASAGAADWVAVLHTSDAAEVRDVLLKLSALAQWDDRVGVVSGSLSQAQGERVLWAGGVFTSEGVVDPHFNVPWNEGGYYGRLFGQRCVDVAAPVNVLMRCDRLRDALAWLRGHGLRSTPSNLMVALGRLAAHEGWFVTVTPLVRIDLQADDRELVPVDRENVASFGANPAVFSRWYGPHLDPVRSFCPLMEVTSEK